ncbi:butyrate kinase, partial [Candidatus Neomarinimicrobiota bacterium]
MNPGTTSTEVGYFNNTRELWRKNIQHRSNTLPNWIPDQIDYRFSLIKPLIKTIHSLDAIAARGGPLKPLPGGVYRINQNMLEAYKKGIFSNHASNLGALLAEKLTEFWSTQLFIVDPVSTDELDPVARISGVSGVERKARSHALNIKYCVHKATDHAGIPQKKARFIVAHLGTGFSIAAVDKGEIVDVNDALLGMGPFSIKRAGSLPLSGIIDLIYVNELSKEQLIDLLSNKSGLKGYLGTSNFTDIEKLIQKNDQKAKSIFNAMIYQIVKEIGAYYAALGGDISALILTGGLCNSQLVTDRLKSRLKFIKP